VEFGLKAAASVTGRNRFVALKQTYLGAYGQAGTRDSASWLNLDAHECLECSEPFDCLSCDVLKHVDFSEIAAFALEPGSGLGQIRFFPEKMIQAVAMLVRKAGGLVVVDEVTTGMARTGRWFGCEHYGIKPEIVCLGKGLGNGYPVSCVAVMDEVAKELRGKGFRHTQSHQNDPLGCAVACAVIEEMKNLNFVERARDLGEFWAAALVQGVGGFSSVREIWGKGLMLAIEFQHLPDFNIAEFVFEALLKKKIICGYSPGADAIRFLPALTIEKKDLEQTVVALSAILLELEKR
jgi:acetylornithine aminotransferase